MVNYPCLDLFVGEWWWFTGVLPLICPDIWCWCVCFNLFMKLHSNDIQRAALSSSKWKFGGYVAGTLDFWNVCSVKDQWWQAQNWLIFRVCIVQQWMSQNGHDFLWDDFLYKSLWTSSRLSNGHFIVIVIPWLSIRWKSTEWLSQKSMDF